MFPHPARKLLRTRVYAAAAEATALHEEGGRPATNVLTCIHVDGQILVHLPPHEQLLEGRAHLLGCQDAKLDLKATGKRLEPRPRISFCFWVCVLGEGGSPRLRWNTGEGEVREVRGCKKATPIKREDQLGLVIAPEGTRRETRGNQSTLTNNDLG
jgi:hypothetical protein